MTSLLAMLLKIIITWLPFNYLFHWLYTFPHFYKTKKINSTIEKKSSYHLFSLFIVYFSFSIFFYWLFFLCFSKEFISFFFFFYCLFFLFFLKEFIFFFFFSNCPRFTDWCSFDYKSLMIDQKSYANSQNFINLEFLENLISMYYFVYDINFV